MTDHLTVALKGHHDKIQGALLQLQQARKEALVELEPLLEARRKQGEVLEARIEQLEAILDELDELDTPAAGKKWEKVKKEYDALQAQLEGLMLEDLDGMMDELDMLEVENPFACLSFQN